MSRPGGWFGVRAGAEGGGRTMRSRGKQGGYTIVAWLSAALRSSRRTRWLAAVAGIALGGCADTADTRPNIVVILVDDLRWDDFGAGGHPFVETPNIDRIANEGARFLNAFASTPLCSPSRASFLTGLYAHTNGIVDNLARNETSHALQTFPRALNADRPAPRIRRGRAASGPLCRCRDRAPPQRGGTDPGQAGPSAPDWEPAAAPAGWRNE